MTRAIAIAIALAAAIASANPRAVPGTLVGTPAPATTAPPILYLDRCSGNCTITGGAEDAAADVSAIPCATGHSNCNNGASCQCDDHSGTFTLHEFKDSNGNIGSAADAEWNAIVQCVRDVYSPYAVMIADQKPLQGGTYNRGLVGGLAADFGYPPSIGGLGPPSSCSPQSNVNSVTFSDAFPVGDFGGSQQARIYFLCGVISQETAHAYGLEHEYSFTDNTSACRSPMSYRGDCGGEKFFRGLPANCGEYASRPCVCGALQNSHQKLLAAFGAGTPITAPPHVMITSLVNGAMIGNGTAIGVTAGAQRGVEKLELWLNDHNWAEVLGATWGANGQPDPSSYSVLMPSTVPDGIIDIVIKAYDDIAIETDSATVEVTKGAPCTTADACAKGQKCDAGKCYWDPPTGLLGDACTYNEFCTSGICSGTADQQICTMSCVLGSLDACPTGYDCIMTSESEGICFPTDAGGGCCSSSGAPLASSGLAAFVLGVVLRRRRRPSAMIE